MRVILLPDVLEDLENLAEILYEQNYLSMQETALRYVLELYDNIVSNLPKLPHKPAPPYFDKYGKNMSYAAFRKNRQTTWYVFFTQYSQDGDTIYLIQYIANNHTVAQFLESC